VTAAVTAAVTDALPALVLLLAAGAVPGYLPLVVAIVGAAALVAYLSHRAGLVPIVGFLLAGVAIGPHALGLVSDSAAIEAAADVGVLLLLFTIGIEFSLDRLARIRSLILVGGGLQVGLATAVVAGLCLAVGVDWRAAVFTGFLVALSSTAILTKLLADRAETDAPHGQAAIGLLIFQDLAVILMVLLVPALGGQGVTGMELAWALAKAALLIAAVLVVARRVLPPLLEHVARTCSPELFLLTVVAICFGTAYGVGLAGVSISLGAFLAGLVVSQSRFAEHALSEILPLQILFSAVFFVSVGMLLDVGFLLANLPLVLAAVAALAAVKLATTWAAVRAVGRTAPVAAASALLLAQVGEFSFVLERAGREAGLTPLGMSELGSPLFIAATVLSMALTPALAPLAGRMAARRRPDVLPESDDDAVPDAAHFAHLADHVIVAGYGAQAEALADALATAGVPFAIATLSPGGARAADDLGHPVLRGDYTRQPILDAVGLGRARVLVVADDAPGTAHRVVSVARALAPHVRVVATAPTAAAADTLRHAGADHVVAAPHEVAASLHRAVLDAARDATPSPRGGGSAEGGDGGDSMRMTAPPATAPPMTAPWIDLDVPVSLALRPDAGCTHGAHIHAVLPGTQGCAECLAAGERWVHLRVCMSCGHIGCCDSSPGKHATAHYHATGHPVVRSIEPGETWGWCYEDEVEV